MVTKEPAKCNYLKIRCHCKSPAIRRASSTMKTQLLLHTLRIFSMLILIHLRHQVYKRLMKRPWLIVILKEFKIFLSKEKLLSTIMILHRTTIWLRRLKKNLIRKISPLSTSINSLKRNLNLRTQCQGITVEACLKNITYTLIRMLAGSFISFHLSSIDKTLSQAVHPQGTSRIQQTLSQSSQCNLSILTTTK
jgi:hypothetical protein